MGNLDLRVGKKYRLERRIGAGSFGAVYLGLDDDTGDEVAIKLEHTSMRPGTLEDESKIYQTLAGKPGIPRVRWYGEECDYRVMVFELLGPSLEDLFCFCGRKFSLKTVLMLADQLISRLKNMHSKGLIHRDIKPDNILMGVGRRGNEVYITDMGVATEYRSTVSNYRIVMGVPSFACIRGHLGLDQSRRDDMECLGYLILYFIRGSLPWSRLNLSSGEASEELPEKPNSELIREWKETISSKDLCDGLPKEFAAYFDHVRSLQFADKPRYDYLRRILRNLFVREGFKYDHVFDWTIQRYAMTKSQAEAGAGDTDSSRSVEHSA